MVGSRNRNNGTQIMHPALQADSPHYNHIQSSMCRQGFTVCVNLEKMGIT